MKSWSKWTTSRKSISITKGPEIASGPVFFGTPEFALPALKALCSQELRPALVVSQPARPGGRGRQPIEPPVASWAREQGLDVEQPDDVRDPRFLELLTTLEPWVAIVVAFGQIFPQDLLEVPLKGCINLHASLLPKFRGAAPIQAAIMAGESTTGVTTMLMEQGLDSGPILLQSEIEIGVEETAGSLSERLAVKGAQLLVETLDLWRHDQLEPIPQDPAKATFAPRIRRADGAIDWGWTASSIFNRLRGLTPWPGSFTYLGEERIKVLWGRPLESVSKSGDPPGTFLQLSGSSMRVLCGQGTVFGIESLQRAGRRPSTAAEFVNGMRLSGGELLT